MSGTIRKKRTYIYIACVIYVVRQLDSWLLSNSYDIPKNRMHEKLVTIYSFVSKGSGASALQDVL